MVLKPIPPGVKEPMLSRFSKRCVYSLRIPKGPFKYDKNPLNRSTPPLIRNCGKKLYVPSFIRPLKLSSFAKPLDRLCSAEPPKENPCRILSLESFHGVNLTLPTTSGSFVVPAFRSPCPLKMPTQYCARPPA